MSTMNISNWKSTLCSAGNHIARLSVKLKDMFSSVRSDSAINEVLIYGGDDEEQRTKVGLNNLFCIYYVILHASSSVDICAPSLSSTTITKSLISVSQKVNAKIRIAIYNSVDYSSLRIFSKYGIEVKVISSFVQLEHEFILIDAIDGADAVAVIGSLDYEVSRVNCNRDATLITSELSAVSAFKHEFDRIWNSIPDIIKNCYDDNNKS